MVTEFFRDPETFAVLRERVIPDILAGKPEGAAVRVWVAGCASGEEAYSLALTLLDVMAERHINRPLKIFATDISERDLERARRGFYPQSIADAVGPEQLQRYFVEVEGGYRVGKTVREACVFARHDLTRDPPFPRLDLVSCRNVLIYMGAALQRRIVPLLHYGLLPGGYLMLGHAESLGSRGELFEAVDVKHRIFAKKAGPVPQIVPFAPAPPMLEERLGSAGRALRGPDGGRRSRDRHRRTGRARPACRLRPARRDGRLGTLRSSASAARPPPSFATRRADRRASCST